MGVCKIADGGNDIEWYLLVGLVNNIESAFRNQDMTSCSRFQKHVGIRDAERGRPQGKSANLKGCAQHAETTRIHQHQTC